MTFMSTTGQAPIPPVPPVGAAGPPPGPLRMTSGRWIALAIGVPVALALIGWTGFSLVTTVARGSYPFSYTVPVDDGQVAVNINTGNITLREAPGSSSARLSGIVQYGLFRPGISENTTPTGANVAMSCSGINTDCGMNATFDVPPRTAVTVWSNGGDVSAANFSSGMTLWTEGGNVSATNLSGNLQVDTGGGDLTGIGLTGAIQVATEGGNINAGSWTGSGTMRVDSGGGDLTADGLTGNFQLSTEGGNVDASGVASGTVNMDSGGGDVTLAFTQAPKSLVITAEGGNVTVILPPGNTTYNLSLPDTQGGNVTYPSSLINSKSTHKITIDSGGGDITISQG
jgi:Putative adhesin